MGVLPEDDFLQLYTSGTTGRPKGVPQTHAMHLSQRAQWEARLGPFPQDDRVLVFMPCFHAAGVTCVISTHDEQVLDSAARRGLDATLLQM